MFDSESPFTSPRTSARRGIAELRAKIDGHFTSSPLASQRKDFLAVDANTPIEKKAHFTAEIVGAAAAYEAFKAFERHEVHKGAKPTHARAKEVSRVRPFSK